MSRRSKGPRLEIYRREGRPDRYVIRDGARQHSTGCAADDVAGATEALKAYLARVHKPDTGQLDLGKIPVSEVLMLYLQDTPMNSPSREVIRHSVNALIPFWGTKFLSDVKGSTCRQYAGKRWKHIPGGLEPYHSRRKFKAHEIHEIRAASKAGEFQKDIALRYGVDQTAISAIVRRATYQHVT